MRRCNWHSAGSPGWPFPMLKYKRHFYTVAILSNSTRKRLWFEITKMLIAIKNIIFCVIYYNFRHTFVPYDDRQLQSDDDRVLLRQGRSHSELRTVHATRLYSFQYSTNKHRCHSIESALKIRIQFNVRIR